MTLPNNNHIPLSILSRIFDNTTATYKYYWFMSILDIVAKEHKTQMTFWEIIAGMVAESWYPIHSQKLSFGKYDSLIKQSMALQEYLSIPNDADKQQVKHLIISNINDKNVIKLLRVFALNVPCRFLSPWIDYSTDKEVVARSQQLVNDCLYSIYDDEIVINPTWTKYLIENYIILRDFASNSLMEFLQKRNMNINISKIL